MTGAEPKWLEWGRELQAIAQNGLAYSPNPYDVERFERVRELAAEILAHHSTSDPADLVNLFQQEKGYTTPKVDVRGAVITSEGILLVRELVDGGRWTLPGGWADVTDTPSEATLREIREESGYEARIKKLVAVYDRNKRGHPYFYFTTYKLFFLCELTGGAAKLSLETGGAAFFPRDQIPELSLTRVTPGEIQTMFEHYDHPELPTEYD